MLEMLTSLDPLVISTFLLSAVILNLTPGSDVMFTLASSIHGGVRNGFSAAFGITLGTLTHLAIATLGVSAILQAEPAAYEIIKYLGVTYLLYLAVITWNETGTAKQANPKIESLRTFRRGYLTNLLNPKVALFILAFLPQFVDPDIGPAWQQMLIYGFMFATSGLVVTCTYAWGAGWLVKKIKHTNGIFNKISALIFGGIAAKLVLE